MLETDFQLVGKNMCNLRVTPSSTFTEHYRVMMAANTVEDSKENAGAFFSPLEPNQGAWRAAIHRITKGETQLSEHADTQRNILLICLLVMYAHEQHEKAKGSDTERGTPQASRCPTCYRRSVEK